MWQASTFNVQCRGQPLLTLCAKDDGDCAAWMGAIRGAVATAMGHYDYGPPQLTDGPSPQSAMGRMGAALHAAAQRGGHWHAQQLAEQKRTAHEAQVARLMDRREQWVAIFDNSSAEEARTMFDVVFRHLAVVNGDAASGGRLRTPPSPP